MTSRLIPLVGLLSLTVGLASAEDKPEAKKAASADEIKRKIKEFARAFEMPYRCVVNDGTTEAKIPKFGGYPTTLFIDCSGKVRMLQFGYVPKTKLELIVKSLVAERSNPEDR